MSQRSVSPRAALPNALPSPLAGEGGDNGETNQNGRGVCFERLSREANPPPIRIRITTETPSPARGEGISGTSALVAGQERSDYVSVKLKSPSFSIEVTSLSPALSQTCLSFG
jgi:hypothetical protein